MTSIFVVGQLRQIECNAHILKFMLQNVKRPWFVFASTSKETPDEDTHSRLCQLFMPHEIFGIEDDDNAVDVIQFAHEFMSKCEPLVPRAGINGFMSRRRWFRCEQMRKACSMSVPATQILIMRTDVCSGMPFSKEVHGSVFEFVNDLILFGAVKEVSSIIEYINLSFDFERFRVNRQCYSPESVLNFAFCELGFPLSSRYIAAGCWIKRKCARIDMAYSSFWPNIDGTRVQSCSVIGSMLRDAATTAPLPSSTIRSIPYLYREVYPELWQAYILMQPRYGQLVMLTMGEMAVPELDPDTLVVSTHPDLMHIDGITYIAVLDLNPYNLTPLCQYFDRCTSQTFKLNSKLIDRATIPTLPLCELDLLSPLLSSGISSLGISQPVERPCRNCAGFEFTVTSGIVLRRLGQIASAFEAPICTVSVHLNGDMVATVDITANMPTEIVGYDSGHAPVFARFMDVTAVVLEPGVYTAKTTDANSNLQLHALHVSMSNVQCNLPIMGFMENSPFITF
jgi:hypothetical protein